jgi:hypothetical protein
MKILIIIPSYPKISGVDYHRLLQPHKRMAEIFKESVDMYQINEIDTATIEFLQGFDLIVANRFISRVNGSELIQKLKEANVPYVLDIDDDYRLPEWHILAHQAKSERHAEKILQALHYAKAITTTHKYLSGTLKFEASQPNAFEIPNAINPNEEQYQVKKRNLDIVKFGWSGSITHFEDVMLMHDGLLSLYTQEQYKDKFQLIYGGYSKDDEMAKAIAGVLSCKGKASPNQFSTYPSVSINDYARFYDEIDVSLIPLRDNRFNKLKSNLKLIESGFKKKACIVSNVHPYEPMLKHGVNCLVVKHKNDWYKNMVKLINNPAMIEDLSEQLYVDVQVQHIDRIAELRYRTYKKILEI